MSPDGNKENDKDSESSGSTITLSKYPSLDRVVQESDLYKVHMLPSPSFDNIENIDQSLRSNNNYPSSDKDSVLLDTNIDAGKCDPPFVDASSDLPMPVQRKKTSTRKGDYSHLPQYHDTLTAPSEQDEDDANHRNSRTQNASDVLSLPVPADWETLKGL